MTDTALATLQDSDNMATSTSVDPNINPDSTSYGKQEQPEQPVAPSDIEKPSASAAEDQLNITENVENVTPTNTDESIDDRLVLLDLGSKQIEPNTTKTIDLPEEIADEVTLPEFASENDD